MTENTQNTTDEPQANLQPMIRVKDVAKAVRTYTQAGAQKIMEVPGPDGKTLAHAIVAFGNTPFHIGPVTMEGMDTAPDYNAEYEKRVQAGPRGVGVVFYVNVDDVDAKLKEVKAAGFEINTEVIDQFWGDRTFAATDPDGYVWSFAQTVKRMTPEEMLAAMPGPQSTTN